MELSIEVILLSIITPIILNYIASFSDKIKYYLDLFVEKITNKKTYIIEYHGTISQCGSVINNNGTSDYSDEFIGAILFFLKDRLNYDDIISSKIIPKLKNNNNDNNNYSKDFIMNIAPIKTFKYKEFNFLYEENQTSDYKKSEICRRITITTFLKELSDVTQFIETCVDEYKKFNAKCKKLMLVIPNIENDYEVYYTTYDFVSNKTFSNLLCNKKDKILGMLDSLENKKIDKLGILLYGKPGSGKTTMIKCVANYTKRSIVTIDFKQIKSKQILLDILFNTYIGRITLPLSERIYVIEDVDCSSNAVLERTSIIPTDFKKEEYLTLSDILNCIDGILELKDTIMIFTTNYVDKLDKALIRPGRIDLKIELSYMDRESKFAYIKNAYGIAISPEYLNIDVTPAELENLVLLNQDNYENFLIELEKFKTRKE